MSETPAEPTPDALFEDACAWFARLAADDVDPAERELFAAWLAAGPAHAQAWAEAQALFAALEQPAKNLRRREAGAAKPRRRRVFHPLLVLACLSLCAVVWLPELWQDWRSDFHTAIGERRRVTLADGSTLLLNTDSAVAVEVQGRVRRVKLLRGEAFFEVARAPQRPFWVEAGAARARAVGTAFSVGLAEDRVEVDVAEGRVETSSVAEAAPPVALSPGEAASYRGGYFAGLRHVDVNRELAWRKGQLVFVQTPLAEVVAQINRYRPGRLLIADPALRGRSLTAVFDLDRLDDAVAALEQSLGLRVRRFTPYLVLLG